MKEEKDVHLLRVVILLVLINRAKSGDTQARLCHSVTWSVERETEAAHLCCTLLHLTETGAQWLDTHYHPTDTQMAPLRVSSRLVTDWVICVLGL